jgi:hypothetical protein
LLSLLLLAPILIFLATASTYVVLPASIPSVALLREEPAGCGQGLKGNNNTKKAKQATTKLETLTTESQRT